MQMEGRGLGSQKKKEEMKNVGVSVELAGDAHDNVTQTNIGGVYFSKQDRGST